MSFSEKHGHAIPRTIIQTDGIDEPLKNGIWNVIYETFFLKLPQFISQFTADREYLVKRIWKDFYKDRVDEIPVTSERILKTVKNRYFQAEWPFVYDFVEFLAIHSNIIAVMFQKGHFYSIGPGKYDSHTSFRKRINDVLERELSGYRLFECDVIPVTKKEEVQEIEQATSQTKFLGLNGVHEHLSSAIDILSNRKQPDYRNVIKESILSVESLAKVISGDANAELGQALKSIEKSGNVTIHKALRAGISSIYGYTSDTNGIRHALLEVVDIQQEDAVYMLVSCSAFVNYLISKAKRSGIKLNGIT